MFVTLNVSFVVTFVIFCGFFYVLLWYVRRRRLCELASKLNGPPIATVIKNLCMLIGNNEDLLNKINNLFEPYPSPCRLWVGPLLFCAITDPEQIKTLCLSSKTLEKGQLFRDIAGVFLGSGLVTAPVPKWRAHRKIIQPTFNKKILDSFVKIFAAQAEIFTKKIERNLGGPEFETFQLFSLCTLDMICESALGVKIGAQSNKNCHYGKAVQQVIDSFGHRICSFWLTPDFIFYRTKSGKDQRKNLKYLHDFAENVIKMKKQELLEGTCCSQLDAVNDKAGSSTAREAFLDHLIGITNDTSLLADEELREEVDTLIVGGNHGIAVTLSFIMLMLASHPDIQDEVYKELYEIYGDVDTDEHPVTADDLMHMKYLECVIKETLRLFPPIPFIVRQMTEDFDLGEHILPEGSIALIGIYSLQRNEKYWLNPLEFNPDRFSADAKEHAKRHPYAFMTFSSGPRNCIGLNYAMMATKTVIATILRRYILMKNNIVPVKDIRLTMDALLKPVIPNSVRIEKRSRN